MELKKYIEAGIAKCGTGVQLSLYLGQHENAVRDAKAHRRGLPVYACIRLAQLIEADPLSVIAASELVTEKKDERRAILLPLVNAAKFPVFAVFLGDLVLKMPTTLVAVIMNAI